MNTPGWIVLWLARIGQYRAYKLSSSRRDKPLTAATPRDLAAKIIEFERSRHEVAASQHVPEIQPRREQG